MATMLSLELTKEATPLDHLLGIVVETATELGLLAAGGWMGATAADSVVTLTSGLMIDISPPYTSGEDLVIADFGSRVPSIVRNVRMARAATVDFTLGRGYDVDLSEDQILQVFDLQWDQLLEMVFWLLDVVLADAVLHYEFAEVYLMRLGGRVTLNYGWPPERLARVPVPYQQAALTFRNA